jgi:metallophosphoesterase superfamily enzyme
MEQYKEWATQRQCEIIDAVIANGTQAAAADELGVTKRSVERALARVRTKAAKHGYSPDHNMTHTAPNTHIVKGASTLYGDDGEVKLQWVKTDLKKEVITEALQSVADDLCHSLPKYKPNKNTPKNTTDALTAYVIGDGHIGMSVSGDHNLADGSWNLDIAESTTVDAIATLIDISHPTEIGMLVDVGDFMHINDSSKQTQSGNVLDVDGDLKDIVRATVRIYRNAIDMMLDKHNQVVMMMVRGNHNKDAALIINTMLEVVYEDEPRVTILCNRHKFMQYEYGNNFFGAHHGDRMKIDQAYQFFTRTFAESWGRTKHRHTFMGHIHHHQAKEVGGMLFETYNSLTTTDEWHTHSGYGAKRTMTSIIFDKEYGEVQRHKIGIAQLRAA